MNGSIRSHLIDLKAGIPQTIPGPGSDIAIKYATAPLDFEFLDQVSQSKIGEAVGMDSSDSFGIGGTFGYVVVTSSTDQAVRLLVSTGAMTIRSISAEVYEKAPASIQTQAPVALAAGVASEVSALNLNRKEAVLKSAAGNTSDVFISASGTIDHGVPLSPGEFCSISTADVIMARSADNATLYVMELIR